MSNIHLSVILRAFFDGFNLGSTCLLDCIWYILVRTVSNAELTLEELDAEVSMNSMPFSAAKIVLASF